MQIYLPIAEMAVSVELVFFVSIFAGFLSGLFGIGGGFLMTPFMIFLGVPPVVAVGTQPCQIVASSMSGMLGHLRKSNVDFKMGGVMLIGSVAGMVVGMIIFKILQYLGQIDFVISLLYAALLGGIGALMFVESVKSIFMKKMSVSAEFNSFKISSFVHSLPFKMRFSHSKLYVSALLPMAVGFVSGILAAILGIGGGFMLVPAMLYILGMPAIVVTGTSLFQIVFTTSFATIMHASVNHTVDILLALILIAGGVIGAQLGVNVSRLIKGNHARIVLSVLILIVSFRLCLTLFMMPEDLFSVVAR